jgi:hypothetical protein
MVNQNTSSVISGTILVMNYACLFLVPTIAPASAGSIQTAMMLNVSANNSSTLDIGRSVNREEVPDTDQPETITSLADSRRRFLSLHPEEDVLDTLPVISLREG